MRQTCQNAHLIIINLLKTDLFTSPFAIRAILINELFILILRSLSSLKKRMFLKIKKLAIRLSTFIRFERASIMLNIFQFRKPKNLVQSLQNKANKTPNKVAFRFLKNGENETDNITYKALDEKAKAIGYELQANTLTHKRTAILLPPGLDFIEAFMGCLYAKSIAIPINCPPLSEFTRVQSLLETIANDAEISAIIINSEYLQKVKELNLETIKEKIDFIEIENIDITNSEKYLLPSISEEDIAFLQYTSGSTSTPKGVIIRHRNLTHNLLNTARAWQYSKKSITVNWCAHTHIYGLMSGFLIPLYHGAVSIIIPPLEFIKNPVSWLKAISHYHATHSGCPNFGYELCIKKIERKEVLSLDLSSWKVAVNGGEPVSIDTMTKFTNQFCKCNFNIKHFRSEYGMSEATGLIASGKHNEKPNEITVELDLLNTNKAKICKKISSGHSRTIVSNGHVIDQINIKIIDTETLLPVNEGNIGEIWLSGKSIADGYWNKQKDNEVIFKNRYTNQNSNVNYFRTGDLGFIKNGEIYLTGRLKELIIIYGKNYYPTDIEFTAARALQQPKENVTAVFAIEKNQAEAVIIIQEYPEHDVNYKEAEKKIRRSVTDTFGIDIYGIIFVKRGSIPKTLSGKIQRSQCRQLFLKNKLDVLYQYYKDQDINSPTPSTSSEVQSIKNPLSNHLKIDLTKLAAETLHINLNEIHIDDNLSDYGFDSITITQFVTTVNKKFSLNFTPAHFFEYQSLNDFAYDILNGNKEIIAKYYANKIENIDSIKHPQSDEKEKKYSLEKNQSRENEDIAIIGMSAKLPGANDLEDFWQILLEEKNQITQIPKSRWNWEDYNNETHIKWGGFIDGIDQFDADFFNISRREAEMMDPQQRLFLETAWKAIELAGYKPEDFAKVKTGLFVGVTSNDYAELLQKSEQISSYTPTGNSHSVLANRVSFLLNLTGPSIALDTACSSSLVALHLATKAIQDGDCDCALVGGVNAILSPTLNIALDKAGMLSQDGKCKTFDKSANGYARGEGVGIIILKPVKQALADRDTIYGIIKGTAVNHGGHVTSLTVPNPNAQAELIINAVTNANIDVDTISYIETHGTGTSLGDPIEINGLKKAFSILQKQQNKNNSPIQFCGLGSVKTNIGHLEAAAGIAGVIKVLLAMHYKKIPGTVNFKELNPYIQIHDSPFYITTHTRNWLHLKNPDKTEIPLRAGISSFGFGGSNAHIILEEALTEFEFVLSKKPYYLLTLSAKTETALKQRISDLIQWLEKPNNKKYSLADICYTLNVGRNHFDKRCALVVNSIDNLKESLKNVFENNSSKNAFISNEIQDKRMNQILLKEIFNNLFNSINQYPNLSEIEYRDKLITLANFYIEGYEIDWIELHRNESKNRIPVTTYPFAKDRYWIPDVTDSTEITQSKSTQISDENTIKHALTDYTKSFSGREFYLKDHLINGTPVLPAVIYLEMARTAYAESYPKQKVINLKDIVWVKPIQITQATDIKIHLYQPNNDICFEVINKNEINEKPTIYAQGKIVPGKLSANNSEKINILDVKARCINKENSVNLYSRFSNVGMQYGPSLRVIQDLYTNDQEALALLELPTTLELDNFSLHPSLLDGALQTTFSLLDNENTHLYLPFSLGQLEVYGSLPKRCYVHTKKITDKNNIYKFNINVSDLEGNLLLKMIDFTVINSQKIHLPNVKNVVTSDNISILKIDQSELEQKTEEFLKKILAEELKTSIDRIQPTQAFENFGIDSIVIVNLNRVLESIFGDLPKTLLFEYQNLAALTQYFVKNHAAVLSRILSVETKPSEPSQPIDPQLSVSSFTASADENDDIAIIGLSGRYPDANDLDTFWNNIKSGKDSIKEIPIERWDYRPYFDSDKNKSNKIYGKWGSFIDDVDKFDPLFFNISPKEAELIDPQERLFLETSWKTIEDAGYSLESLADKKTGVFVGIMYGEYQLLGAEETLKGNITAAYSSYASVANRVSYFLNFHGPSMAIDTMCSSSLTAIQLACDNIRLGRCQLAIAGGVNVSIHPNKYILLSQGKFLSSQGHCQSFGEGGDGYVPGEGVGAVLLKPLRQALIDGDHIYAVIKGSSMNHGGKTNGYTVPNPNAQAELIQEAFTNAHIEPSSISYVEAHGTGTSLGDPIEITGLTKAFGTQTRAIPCAIGSIKSNIGHLESAAGIAGVTKVLLQFKHHMLAPSIHSEKLNPNINFSKTSFTVQQTLSPWEPIAGQPLRASISSFGAGGANAHVILEEAPTLPASHYPEKSSYLITLSAKSDYSLLQKINDLLAWITHQDTHAVTLNDISYTLNAGRNHYDKRCAIVASTLSELHDTLLQLKQKNQPVNAFLGSTVANVDADVIHKKALEKLIDDLSNYQKLTAADYKDDLLALAKFYIDGYNIPWEKLHQHESNRRISLPTYPFIKKRCWIKTTLPKSNEDKLISTEQEVVGEFYDELVLEAQNKDEENRNETFLTFGTLNEIIPGFSWSGVFISGKDESTLINAQKEMRSILFRRTDFTECKKILDFGCGYGTDLISLAQDYPHLQLEGYTISNLQKKQAEKNVKQKNLQDKITIYHRDSSIDEFPGQYDVIFGFEVAHHIKNKSALFSNISKHLSKKGKLILADFVSHTEFAIEHEKTGSYFSTKNEWANILASQKIQLIECVDASREIANFLHDPDFEKNFSILINPAVKEAFLSYHQLEKLLTQKMASYVLLTAIHQPDLTVEELNRHNLDMINYAIPYKNISHIESWLYKTVWVDQTHLIKNQIDLDHCVLIFSEKENHLAAYLQNQFSIKTYLIENFNNFNWKALFDDITKRSIQHIIYLAIDDKDATQDFLTPYQRICMNFLRFAQAYSEYFVEKSPMIWFVTQGAHLVDESDINLSLIQAPIASMVRTWSVENPIYHCASLDLDNDFDEKQMAEAILNTITTDLNEGKIAIRKNQLLIARLQKITNTAPQIMQKMDETDSENTLSKETCLITGYSGIGIKIMEWLLKQNIKNFLFVSRSDPSQEILQKIHTLKSAGINIITAKADVTNITDLKHQFKAIKESGLKIRYIIHAAGVIQDAAITNQSDETMRQVLLPKVVGAWNLHQITKSMQLKEFILFSSAASILGSPGQINYVAANSFLDQLAQYRRQNNLPGLSINWGSWGEVGMASRLNMKDHLNLIRNGIYDIGVKQGLEAFSMALQINEANIIIAPIDWDRYSEKNLLMNEKALTPILVKSVKSPSNIISMIRTHVAEVTGIDLSELNDQSIFSEIGIDSVMVINLRNRIQSEFAGKLKIPSNIFYEHPTILQLAAYIDDRIKEKDLKTDIVIQSSKPKSIVIQKSIPVSPPEPANSVIKQHEPIASNSQIIQVAPANNHLLSFGQERMFFAYLLEPTVPSYNCSMTIQFQGQLNIPILKQACQELMQRHSVLRSIFSNHEGEMSFTLQEQKEIYFDIIKSPANSTNQEHNITNRIQKESDTVFDLLNGPLVRFILIESSNNLHTLIVSTHHIVTDGASYVIFLRDLANIYNAKIDNMSSSLPALPIQYSDFSYWQHKWIHSNEAKLQIEYWKNTLKNVPTHLNLPTDKLRDFMPRHRMEVHTFDLPNELSQDLIAFSKKNHVTLFCSLFSIFQILLARLSNQNEFIIGVLTSGRNHTEIENLIGFFLNILPIPVHLHDNPNFIELTNLVNDKINSAFINQDVPIEVLFSELKPNRELGSNPLFQVVFVYQNLLAEQMSKFKDLQVETINLYNGISNDDLVLEIRPVGSEFQIYLKYNTDLFVLETVKTMADQFIDILKNALKDPTKPVIQSHIENPLLTIASTFTAEPIQESLLYWLNLINRPSNMEFSPYNQVFQELLNPASKLNQNSSGINILLIRFEDWLTHSFSYNALMKVIDEFLSAVNQFMHHSKIPLIISICPPSPQFLAKFMEKAHYDLLEDKVRKALQDKIGIYLMTQAEMKKYYIRDYYDPVTDASGHIPFTTLYFTALGTLISRMIYALLSKPYKVIVLDGDNTLWQGILGEEGVDGVQVTAPYIYLQQFMAAQNQAGMLLCLCSKNNENDVITFFDKHPSLPLNRSHFTAWKINWQNKSESIKELAQELQLGLDSFIFLDDNVMECEEVRSNCPDVLTLKLPNTPEKIPDFLNNIWALDHIRVTQTDKDRPLLYKQQIHRDNLRKSAKNYKDFLASLNLDISFLEMKADDIPRVAQLTQRTNQFNMTTIRKNEAEISSDKKNQCLTIHVKDRFGSYGLVGAVFYTYLANKLIVQNILLSCRVLGKGVENRIISELGQMAKSHHCQEIIIQYIESKRNTPAKQFLDILPAQITKSESTIKNYILSVEDAINFKFSEAIHEEKYSSAVSMPILTGSTNMTSETAQEISTKLTKPALILDDINFVLTKKRDHKTEMITPRSKLEITIAKVFSDILHVDSVSISDNFFDLGVTSLMMVKAQSLLQHDLDYEISLLEFFNHPTVSSLATFLTENQDKIDINKEDRGLLELAARKRRTSHLNKK